VRSGKLRMGIALLLVSIGAEIAAAFSSDR
jgi:hypothetical protein